jgi:hypothetical protein
MLKGQRLCSLEYLLYKARLYSERSRALANIEGILKVGDAKVYEKYKELMKESNDLSDSFDIEKEYDFLHSEKKESTCE